MNCLEVSSISHHQRMLEAWTHKKFQLEYHLETLHIFALPLKLCPLGESILDVGSGIGTRVASLRNMGISAYGIDTEPKVVAMSINEAKGFNTTGNLLNLSTYPCLPRFIISDDVLEHIPLADIKTFLDLARQINIREMVHSITTLEHEHDIHNDPTHASKLYAAQWKSFFAENNWKTLGPTRRGKRHGVFHLIRTK